MERLEVREFLTDAAKSEMKHVQEFQDLIIGLGGVPLSEANYFPKGFTAARDIIQYATDMENEVVSNYFQRMQDAATLGDTDGRWVEVFLEDQMLHSRMDADNMKQMVAGMAKRNG